jgi:pilus assembly protein CpaE
MAQKWQPSPTGLGGLHRKLDVMLSADRTERDAIQAALAAVAEPPMELRDAGNDGPPAAAVDVVLFVFDRNHEPESVPAVAPAPGAERPVRIALMRDRSAPAIRDALRAGADDVLFLPLDQEHLTRALLKVSESRIAQTPAARAKFVSVVSITGGAGVTTVAANCALALANCAAMKVALVDLDFQAGALEVALNVEPERGILDLNEAVLRLNSVQIESALTRHASGVYLLAAPRRLEESEQIPPAHVGALLDLMGEMVDIVIIDIGRHINDVSLVAWERCDELLYVLDQSIAAMRGAWRFLDLFGRLELSSPQPRFVLNRWVARHPIGEKHIVSTLGRPLLCRIPRDDAAVEQTIVRGEDLWKAAPRSALTRSYEVLARQIIGHAPDDRKRSPFLSKIFSRNGAHPRS